MSDTKWLTSDELHVWRWLAATMLLLPSQLEEKLQPHGLTFFEYSIMAGLSDAEDRTWSMSKLAEIANGSLSRLSHAARRLEARGWLRRHPSPEDGRVTLATLTDEGQAQLDSVAPSHVESVRQAVFDVLSGEQVAQLEQICSAIAQGISPGPAPWDRQ